MKVQINSDSHVVVNGEVSAFVQGEVDRALGRFEDWLTRVEVHLSDLDGPKSGAQPDKRCIIEARPAGRQPLKTSDDAQTVNAAVSGAANKMKRQLETEFGRAADKQ